MSDELNEKALERAMLEMMGHKIALHPDKIFIPRYAHESDAEYAKRFEAAKLTLNRAGFDVKGSRNEPR